MKEISITYNVHINIIASSSLTIRRISTEGDGERERERERGRGEREST